MAEQQVLEAEARSGVGKGVARKLRAQGRVPGVLYGRGIAPVPLAVDGRTLSHLLTGGAGANVLVELRVDGGAHLTLPRSVERDPVRGNILHVDFLKVSRDDPVRVEVPVHIEGNAKGVREGGVLEHHLWQVTVECLPQDVPDRINVDVTDLEVGTVLHVSDLAVPSGVSILSPADEIVLSCVVPQKPEEQAAGEAPAEGIAGGGEAGTAPQGE